MTVLRFPPPALHVLHGVDEPCCSRDDGDRCPICNGGLAYCRVCRGGEGALPTDCPGYEMPGEVKDAVYAGEVDYLRREGWVSRPSALGAFIKRDSEALQALRDGWSDRLPALKRWSEEVRRVVEAQKKQRDAVTALNPVTGKHFRIVVPDKEAVRLLDERLARGDDGTRDGV